ncbi:galanin peptides-like isoform X2 [Pseudorasbora parva]
MQKNCALLCISLCVFTAHLSRIHGMTLTNPEKKGWTLHSAGYLLGPYAHRTLRHRATGKRDISNESSSVPTPSFNYYYLLSRLGHLAYLRLKEMGMTEDFSGSLINDNMKQ